MWNILNIRLLADLQTEAGVFSLLEESMTCPFQPPASLQEQSTMSPASTNKANIERKFKVTHGSVMDLGVWWTFMHIEIQIDQEAY